MQSSKGPGSLKNDSSPYLNPNKRAEVGYRACSAMFDQPVFVHHISSLISFVIAAFMQAHTQDQMCVYICMSMNSPSHHNPSPTNNCEALSPFKPNLTAVQRFLTGLFPMGLYK